MTTINTPTFEETIIDISTTESELQTYKVLAESYDLLANLTDQSQAKRLEYSHTARMFEQKAVECEKVMNKIIKYIKELKEVTK
jgi:hypothetical protein